MTTLTGPLPTSPAEERAAAVKAWRHVAFLLERHPDLPEPTIVHKRNYPTKINEIWISLGSYTRDDSAEVRAQMQKIVRALRASYFKVHKDYTADKFELSAPVAPGWKLVVRCDREAVCLKRVVGERTVQKPVYETIETRTETVTEEIVEWDCEPILASEAI